MMTDRVQSGMSRSGGAAVVKKDFEPNEPFWQARTDLGLSRPEVADAANREPVMRSCGHVPMDENYIGRVEQGRIGGGMCPERLSALCAVLKVTDPAKIGLVAERQLPTRSAPTRFRNAVRHITEPEARDRPSNEDERAADFVDAPESPEDLVVILDGLTEVANQRGWNAIRPLITRNLHGFDRLRRQGRKIDGQLAFADSRWSEFMSWVCDNGGSEEGERWLSRAYSSSLEADDQILSAYMLMRKSQRALDNGDARSAITLSRKALDGDGLPPRIQALCLTRLAEGLALSGEEESLELLTVASRQTRSPSQGAEVLIGQHCNHRYVLAAQARCHHLLGRRREAIAIIDDILADPAPAAPVDEGMWMIYRADAYSLTDPEMAATAGHEALSIANGGASARFVRALLPLAVALRPYGDQARVQAFLTAHRAALAGLLPL